MKRRGVVLEQRQTDRLDARRPWATALGLAAIGVNEGWGAYGDVKRARREEATMRSLAAIGQDIFQFKKATREAELEAQRGKAAVWRPAAVPSTDLEAELWPPLTAPRRLQDVAP